MFGIEFSTFYGYAVLRKSVANHGQNDLWDLYLDGKFIQAYRWDMPDLNDLREIQQMKSGLEFFLDNTVGAPKLNVLTNEVEMDILEGMEEADWDAINTDIRNRNNDCNPFDNISKMMESKPKGVDLLTWMTTG